MYTNEEHKRHPVILVVGSDANILVAAMAAKRQDIITVVEPQEVINQCENQRSLSEILDDFNKTMTNAIEKIDIKIEKLAEKEQCNKSTKYYKRRSKFYF